MGLHYYGEMREVRKLLIVLIFLSILKLSMIKLVGGGTQVSMGIRREKEDMRNGV